MNDDARQNGEMRGQGFKASIDRISATFIKETLQLYRDRVTFATMLLIPLMQLILFGYAINTNPRHLPTAILMQDDSPFARSFLSAMTTSAYFDITTTAHSEEELYHLITSGTVQFGVQIPPFFGRDLMRGAKPAILVIADATDPAATGGAEGAVEGLAGKALNRDLQGAAANAFGGVVSKDPPYQVILQRRYNPTADTQLNIVPGLTGVILTLTMLIFTAMSVTREVERGTMENLLAMPIRPIEIMLGKIAPYALVGAAQMIIILLFGWLMFDIPMIGSLSLLVALTLLFVVANLSMGYTFSTIAESQLQAMQMSFFFFLPNLLLSGFMFPFRGMPYWAQIIGEMMPLTHYLRIVRGIMLKGAEFADLQTDVLALAAFTLVVMGIALARFRQTLD